jgi:hypothetical protein
VFDLKKNKEKKIKRTYNIGSSIKNNEKKKLPIRVILVVLALHTFSRRLSSAAFGRTLCMAILWHKQQSMTPNVNRKNSSDEGSTTCVHFTNR